MSNTIEWWTDTIRYDAGDLGYVMLQLPALNLQPVNYKGIQFEPKAEIHCSLLCVPKLAAAFDVSAKSLADEVRQFVQSNTISFEGFGKDFYICEYEGAHSIITTAHVNGIADLFAYLRNRFTQLQGLQDPSLHVTLFKHNHRYGIGIQNDEERARLCRPIPEYDLIEIRKVIL